MCTDTAQFIIQEPEVLMLKLDSVIPGKCFVNEGIILVTANGGVGGLQYQWSDGTTLEDNYTALGGTNLLMISDTNSCTAQLAVDINCIDHLNIPELLTPNDDGYSDNWEIIDLYRLYPHNDVTIINRWGNKVYFKHGYNNEFTGLPNTGDTLNSGYLPSGTYFYVINLGIDDKILTGYIELIR
jgi:gliding motility-associated-like protein